MSRGESLVFADGRCAELSARLRDDYAKARPFPHVVIDQFHGGAVKLGSKHELQFPELTRQLLYQFNSSHRVFSHLAERTRPPLY